MFVVSCLLFPYGWPAWHLAHKLPVILIFTAARYDIHIPLIAPPVGFLVLFFVGVVLLLFLFGLCVFGFCFSFGGCCFFQCGMTSYGFGTTNTRSLLRFASLTVISTASKHLHNDLAKAIKALEQKKQKKC